jgi:iron uptake system component EfeO
MRRLSLCVAVAALVAAACTSKAKVTVSVVSTNTTCEPASATLPAGRTTFAVRNSGSQVTEMYVLQGTKTIGEVEDIGPGTTRSLTVNLKAGDYDLNCKPGQKGDGIKTPIHVT